MEKQTKNIITREWVEKELRFYNKADMRSALVFLCASALFFVPLTILLVYGIISVWGNFFKAVLLSVAVVLISAPLWGFVLSLGQALKERKLLLRHDYEITTRSLLYKSEERVNRQRQECLHFLNFEKIQVDHTIFQLSEKSDDFYIVNYKGSKKIKLCYSAKMYDYKEEK